MDNLIISFNLRYNNKSDRENAWPYRLDGVLAYIREKNPLLIGTQEGLAEMIKDLEINLPNYKYIGVPRSNEKMNAEYNAIFFNADILRVRKSETIWISETPYIPHTKGFDASLPRMITYGEFYFINKPEFRFRVYNTHLDHHSEAARIEGVKLLRSLIKEHNDKEVLPLFVTGDFNATKAEDCMYYLRHFSSLIHANDFIAIENYGTSFHEFTGKKEGLPIDHIFVNEAVEIKKVVINRDKYNDKYLTDHYPLELYFKFK